MRPACFCAYMRWSAVRSASAASRVSAGSVIAPNEQPTKKPSPCWDSASAAPSSSVPTSAQPGSNSAQNSSPPMRKTRPRASK